MLKRTQEPLKVVCIVLFCNKTTVIVYCKGRKKFLVTFLNLWQHNLLHLQKQMELKQK